MMKSKDLFLCRRWTAVLVTIFFAVLPRPIQGGINPGAKFLFLNEERRSFSLPITNSDDGTVEVSITVKFGYVVSNDSGQATVVYDSTGKPPQSAADWVKVYPQRFILGPLETQIVRLAALPPPNLPAGEYWARVMVTSQITKSSLALQGKKVSGMIFAQQLGLPFHYRRGSVTTGLDVQNFNADVSEKSIQVTMDMTRTGNAAYWGTVGFRLFNNDRRRMFDSTSNVVVYTKFNTVYSLDRKGIPPGDYTLEVELKNEGRRDIRKTDIIQGPPIRLTKSITIR